MKKAVQITCGLDHSFALTKFSQLYGFGFNSEGRIGCGNNTNQLKPIKIYGFNNEKLVSIACGAGHWIASQIWIMSTVGVLMMADILV
jgi:alpha-tubulin suppressor-like RCC1 family protein